MASGVRFSRIFSIRVTGAQTHGLRTALEKDGIQAGSETVNLLKGRRVGARFEVELTDGRKGTFTGRVDDLPRDMLAHAILGNLDEQTYVRGDDMAAAKTELNRVLADIESDRPELDILSDPKRFAETGAEHIDYSAIKFGVNPAPAMFFAVNDGRGWSGPLKNPMDNVFPYGTCPISPAAAGLSYGQLVWEGGSIRRGKDGRLYGWRWQDMGVRFAISATESGIAPVPVNDFMKSIVQAALENADQVPPSDSGAIQYARPILAGWGEELGVKNSPIVSLMIYYSLVGAYHTKPLRLLVPDGVYRATKNGSGYLKHQRNYSGPAMIALTAAKKAGFSEVLFLGDDALRVTESGSANFFCILNGGTILTPSLGHKDILPGITRSTVIALARAYGYRVIETDLTIDFVLQTEGFFETGNAVGISEGESITYRNKELVFNDSEAKRTIARLQSGLRALRFGDYANSSLAGLPDSFWGTVKENGWLLDLHAYAKQQGLRV